MITCNDIPFESLVQDCKVQSVCHNSNHVLVQNFVHNLNDQKKFEKVMGFAGLTRQPKFASLNCILGESKTILLLSILVFHL